MLAIFAYGAWQETRIDFQLDQRPILDTADAPVPGHIDGPNYDQIIKGHIAWNYTIRNYGKGAAFNVRICSFMRIGGSQFIASSGGTSDSKIVSTKFIWQTAIFPDPMDVNEVRRINQEEYGIVLKLKVFYKDTFGTVYTDAMCQSKLPNDMLTVSTCSGTPYIYIPDNTDRCETTYK